MCIITKDDKELLDFIAINPATTKTEIDKRFNPNRERCKIFCLNLDLWLLKENKLLTFLSTITPDNKYQQLIFLNNKK